MFGDGIYYVPASRQIWFYSFADKQPRHVFDLNKDLGSGFAISPDRKWLLFAPGEVRQGDLYLVDNINRSSGQGMPPASPRAVARRSGSERVRSAFDDRRTFGTSRI